MEQFLAKNTVDGGFLQSDHWAKFKKETGSAVFEFGDGENFRALVVEHKLPIVGSYWFVPRGPVFQVESEKLKAKSWLVEIIDSAKKNGAGWVRIEPQREEDLEMIKSTVEKIKTENPPRSPFSKGGGRIVKSRKNHEPAQTLMVDLTGSEEEILMSMKSKTRYNIRLSGKKGVNVFETRKKKDIKKFCELLDETAKRDKITNHPHGHYFDLLEKIDEKNMKLFLARFEGKSISGALVSFFGEVATYIHGASSNQHRNVMAPFGLHWKIIQGAKREGMKKYDLGGTKLVKSEKPKAKSKYIPKDGSWQGITRFKQGFCPNREPIEFPGCYDIVLSPAKYQLYLWLQKLKSIF